MDKILEGENEIRVNFFEGSFLTSTRNGIVMK